MKLSRGTEILLYNTLYDGIQDQVYIMKPIENKFVYAFINEVAIKETGLSKKIIGKAISDVLPSVQASFLISKYNDVLHTKKLIEYEDQFEVNAKTKYSKTTLSPIKKETGEIKAIVAVVKDITQQKIAEKELGKLWGELNKSKKRYQSLFKDNPDPIISFDLEGRIVNSNPQVENVTGYKPIELIGLTFSKLVDEKSNHKLLDFLKQPSSGQVDLMTIQIKHRTNRFVPVSVKISPLILDNQVEGVYVILRDLTNEIETKKKLEESEERFRLIAENAHDMITLLNHQGRIIYASPSYKRIVGYSHNEYIGRIFSHNIHIEDQERLNQIIVKSIQEAIPFSIQNKHYCEKGSYIWVEANGTPVFNEAGKFKHMVVLARDITVQKEYEQRLEYYAMHDFLTDLPNRRLFKKQLTERLEQDRSDRLAIMMLDIDNFKLINDSYGHDVGDAVIVEFGQRLSRLLSKNDMVARLGGDEFIIMLDSADTIEFAQDYATKIKNEIKKTWELKETLQVTTSIGITVCDPSIKVEKAFDIMKQADVALYEAKKAGKNGFHVYRKKL
ncbi:PAS domain S-box protein [Gracilibacillus massiliensis]|uniref:PAS domain S-box protein n=1 Tax=Gracilibacillus massiliensis TaxID=1564956 RepID=UPI00071D8B87|nr:PAS domain S-box protein [Gracilibacillus massiliensis]